MLDRPPSEGKVESVILDFEAPQTWPADLRAILEAHHDLFLAREKPLQGNAYDVKSWDWAITEVERVLRPYALIGWHCTRLTEPEIEIIKSNGMDLPNGAMLARRIDALVTAGLLSPTMGAKFKAANQADEANRAGRIWFCFFPPHRAGERGIRDLVGYWGGEALYNSHDRDPKTSAALKSIGVPAIVEAVVPIALLRPGSSLALKVVRRFLIDYEFRTQESCDHEDPVVQRLPTQFIRQVFKFPEADFVRLTDCASWREPLKLTNHGSC